MHYNAGIMDISIYTAINLDGVEAHIFETRKGFAVRILDADAGEWVPGSTVFSELQGAQGYADLCVRS
jgi:hypothetical protein